MRKKSEIILCPHCGEKITKRGLKLHIFYKHKEKIGASNPAEAPIKSEAPVIEKPEADNLSVILKQPEDIPKTIDSEAIAEAEAVAEAGVSDTIAEQIGEGKPEAPAEAPAIRPATIFTKEHGKIIGKLPFNILSYFAHPCFNLTEEEAEALGVPMQDVLNRYMGNFQHSELLIFGMVFGSIILQKADMFRKAIAEEKKIAEAEKLRAKHPSEKSSVPQPEAQKEDYTPSVDLNKYPATDSKERKLV
jgi:hypothetical protein